MPPYMLFYNQLFTKFVSILRAHEISQYELPSPSIRGIPKAPSSRALTTSATLTSSTLAIRIEGDDPSL